MRIAGMPVDVQSMSAPALILVVVIENRYAEPSQRGRIAEREPSSTALACLVGAGESLADSTRRTRRSTAATLMLECCHIEEIVAVAMKTEPTHERLR